MLAGVLIFARYFRGYLANGQVSLPGSCLLSFVLMVVYGSVGGFIGEAGIASIYNRVPGASRGIRMEPETGS